MLPRLSPGRARASALALLLALGAAPLAAQGADGVRLPRLFQDGMVLQRGARIPVWGWAPPGTAVTVALDARTERAVAGADGGWEVRFPALPAGGPHTLAVEGGGARVRVADVQVGDVWVASGQSNMEWPLAMAAGGAQAVATANDPLLREFAVPHSYAEDPADDLAGGSWARADSAHAGAFSAVAYFFAREVRASQRVPVGVIHTSWGGANVESWTSRPGLGMDDAAWAAVLQRERGREAAVRDTLSRKIGTLPERDEGLVDGRAVWADPALDEGGWTELRVPGTWEDAGFGGLDGVAWYRTAFMLTAEEARAGVRLSLGAIDDDDVTWINGVEAGRTSGYTAPRAYTLPASALRAGRNVIAIRVADGGGGGGITGPADRVWVETSAGRRPLAGTWKFRVGEVSFREDGQRINKVPSYLYNRMIHPLLRYPVRGVIWYQGESNANSDEQARAYAGLFAGMIRDWRGRWTGGREMPFLWVQLPNYGAVDSLPPATGGWALLRESQTAALALPATGQVVAIDLGEADELHPRGKRPVGERLAAVARRVVYGERVEDSGPIYRRHQVHDGRVTVEMDHAAGLALRGAADRVFAVAGADRRWVWARAEVRDGRLVVWSPEVPNPVAVRYAWSNSPASTPLFNAAGLPARPFRTDAW